MKKLLALLFILSIIPFACPEGGYTVLDGEIQPGGIPGFGGSGGVVESVVAGSNATVDATDPQNPIVSATGILASDNLNWTSRPNETHFTEGATFDVDQFRIRDYGFGGANRLGFAGAGSLTADRTYTFPDNSGVLALLENFAAGLVWEAAGGLGSLATLTGPGTLNAGSDYSILAGSGTSIDTTGDFNAILSGEGNTITSGSYNIVVGGGTNTIVSLAGSHNFIGGGGLNTVTGAGTDYNVIGGGKGNTLSAGVSYSVVGGGSDNLISGTTSHSGIGGGRDNMVTSGGWSVIGGGRNNLLSGSDYSVIGGGYLNEISGASHYSAIGGGYLNTINNAAQHAIIPGGRENLVTEDYGIAAGYKSEARSAGAVVFSDSDSVATVDGGNDSFTLNFSGGLDLIALDVDTVSHPPDPAAGRITLYCTQRASGADTVYDTIVRFSDGQTNVIATQTISP